MTMNHDVSIDPLWISVNASAKKSAPGIIIRRRRAAARRERRKTNDEIITASDDEIAIMDKVRLLIYNSLNDATSVPGHVYRALIKEFKEHTTLKTTLKNRRALRDDTHAIVKLTADALIEAMAPAFTAVKSDFFRASPRLLTICKSIVGAIVLGEVYEEVFEEIRRDTSKIGNDLDRKISMYHTKAVDKKSSHQMFASHALETLRTLSEHRSIDEKLKCIVTFLEEISKHCRCQGADSLLKSVCQHIVVALVPNLYTEMTLVEEFLHDELLLLGREGYALVTLQSSIRFMMESTDFEKDIFYDET